jgi:hypothetical protein
MKELYKWSGLTTWFFRLLMALAMLGVQSGCSIDEGLERLSSEQEAALLQRVTERWQAMEERDFARVYQYATPNYRSIFSKRMFLNNFGHSLQWELTGVEVVNYDAQAAVASVEVRVMSAPTKPTSEASRVLGALPATIREKWLLIDGQWWNSAKI